MFAVFEAKGFQYLGRPGDKLKIPSLDEKVGEEVTFDNVLLVKNGVTKIGQPYVEDAFILAEILEHGKYDKIIVFKFKRRNRYRRKRGHTQSYTEIRIKDILFGGKKKILEKKEEVEIKVEKKITEEEKKVEKAAAKPKKAKKTVTRTKKVKKTKGEAKKTKEKAKKPKRQQAGRRRLKKLKNNGKED
jgi:large subunit ribosomal protein L21